MSEPIRRLTLPQMTEAVIAALAECDGTIRYFTEVASDSASSRSEKRHARRMIAALGELIGCNLHGQRLTKGIQIETLNGDVFEITVRQVRKAPALVTDSSAEES